jgi:hypothetical protein
MKRYIIVIAFILLIPGVLITVKWHQNKKSLTEGVECTNNLRMIDSAKEEIAMKLRLGDGAVVTEQQVAEFCKNGQLPTCPSGGKYNILPIGCPAMCSQRIGRSDDLLHNIPIEEDPSEIFNPARSLRKSSEATSPTAPSLNDGVRS